MPFETPQLLPAADAWWQPPPAPDARFDPTGRPFAPPEAILFDQPIVTSLAQLAAWHPRRPAILGATKRLSYAALYDQARALAARLAATTTAGTATAIVALDATETVLALLACFIAGRVALPLDPGHPPARLRQIIGNAGATAVLLGDEAPDFPVPTRLPIAACYEAPAVGATDFAPPDPTAPSVVIHTSGSTGRPRGLARSQRQILRRCQGYIRELRMGETDRTLTLFSPTNGTGLSAAIVALMSGGTLCLPPPASQGLRGLLAWMRAERPSVVWVIPSMLRALLALPGADAAFASVRAIFCASEAILGADIAAWQAGLPPGCAMFCAYGMTEAAGVATWYLPASADAARLPVGYPNPLYDFAIVGAEGRGVADGEIGELWIRGDLVTAGEWRAGEILPGRSQPDPADPSRRILRTGDLARLRADGLLELAGRADAMVKLRGYRVEPTEVEDALRRHSAIADVAVLPLRGETGASLIAHVVGKPGSQPDRASLIAHLRVSLPAYMLPARIAFHPALPRLPNGKLDARKLADIPE